MSEHLTFMMGKHAAKLPTDRQYCRNHMWCQRVDTNRFRFGFSAYAVRLMQDVYFLEWKVDRGTALQTKQEIGFIESSKAQSELYCPLEGTLEQLNQQLLNDPSLINSDTYEEGWLFELTTAAAGTMSASEYMVYLESAWATAQRILKNQVNMDND